MNESLYDVLGVEPTANSDEIRRTWRSLVTVLGPTDQRFASINDAASVLLDAEKRAAYDAALAEDVQPEPEAAPEQASPATVEQPTETPAPAVTLAKEAGSDVAAVEESMAPSAPVEDYLPAATPPPRSLFEILAAPRVAAVTAVVAVALILATSISYLRQDEGPKVSGRTTMISLTDANLKAIKQQVSTRESADITAAIQAAVAAVPKALSYDYRTLAKNEADGRSVMTADYAAKSFTPYFDGLVKPSAPRLKQSVVCGPVLNVGVVRTAPNLVELLLLFDRFAKNTSAAGVSQDFADITMVNQNGTWLISNFATAPIPK